MKSSTIIVILVLLVISVFLIKPDLLGTKEQEPSGLLSIVPQTGTVEVNTEITCSVRQDCIDHILNEDPDAGIKPENARCDKGTCTFIAKTNMPLGVEQ